MFFVFIVLILVSIFVSAQEKKCASYWCDYEQLYKEVYKDKKADLFKLNERIEIILKNVEVEKHPAAYAFELLLANNYNRLGDFQSAAMHFEKAYNLKKLEKVGVALWNVKKTVADSLSKECKISCPTEKAKDLFDQYTWLSKNRGLVPWYEKVEWDINNGLKRARQNM